MSATIRLKESTSLADVLSWSLDGDTTIHVSRRSGFAPGVQGIATSILRNLAYERAHLSVVADFEEPGSLDELLDTSFATPFGYASSRLAKRMVFKPSVNRGGGDFKRLMGKLYTQSQGAFARGRLATLVCLDPTFPLPPALSRSGEEGFPPPSKFAEVMSALLDRIGLTSTLRSARERAIVDLVYELLRNTYEHGRGSREDPTRSTRAVLLEKIVVSRGEDLYARFDADLAGFLSRARENPRGLGLGVLCVTVADQGEGIQNTLPSRDGESESSRLHRAFEMGESRKAKGSINRGMGLSNALACAADLGALLQVASGSLIGLQDFSTGVDKYASLNLSTRAVPSKLGTAISIYVPEYAGELDQRALF